MPWPTSACAPSRAGLLCKARHASDSKLKAILPRIPPLRGSNFDLNYSFIVAYVPLHHAFRQLDETKGSADALLWMANEKLLRKVTGVIWRAVGRASLRSRKVTAIRALQQRGEAGLLDPLDYRVQVQELREGGYVCTFTECAALKVLQSIDEAQVFPAACRLDYLMAHLSGIRFERNKTLADGDDGCDGHILGLGATIWAPERGFVGRK
jgi:hypothetical protein